MARASWLEYNSLFNAYPIGISFSNKARGLVSGDITICRRWGNEEDVERLLTAFPYLDNSPKAPTFHPDNFNQFLNTIPESSIDSARSLLFFKWGRGGYKRHYGFMIRI